MLDIRESGIWSSKYFKYIFQRSHQTSILIMDEKGCIITINRAFTEWFGYLPEDLAGRYTSILFTEQDKKERESRKLK